MKIRRANGEVFDAPANYVLQDGESLVGHTFNFMDHTLDDEQRDVLRDQHIADAQRLSDECAANFRAACAARREQYADYYRDLENAWRSPPPDQVADRQPQPTEWQPGVSLNEAKAAWRAATDKANAEYADRISNAWKGDRP
jgi:hypothetical protein